MPVARRSDSILVASTPRDRHPRFVLVCVASLLVGVLLTVIAQDFLVVSTFVDIVRFAVLTWVVGGGIVLVSLGKRSGWSYDIIEEWFKAGSVYAIVSLGPALLFTWIYHRAGSAATTGASDVASLSTLFFSWLFLLMIAVAVALGWGREPPNRFWQTATVGWLYPVLTVVAVALIIRTNLNIVRADVYFNLAHNRYEQAGEWEDAIEMYRRAVDLAPHQDYYWAYFGRAWLEWGEDLKASQQPQAFQEGRQALERATQLNPRNVQWNLWLAQLFRKWSEVTTDPEVHTSLLNTANGYERRVRELSPTVAELYGLRK